MVLHLWKNISNKIPTKTYQRQNIESTKVLSIDLYWWLRNPTCKIIHDKLYGKKTNSTLINNERVYNVCLSVVALLHKTNVLSLIAPTCSSMLTLDWSSQNVKMAAWLCSLLNHGVWACFYSPQMDRDGWYFGGWGGLEIPKAWISSSTNPGE